MSPKIFGPSDGPVLKSEKWIDIDYGWSHRNYSLLHTWKGFTDYQKIPILLCNFHWIQQCVLDDFFMLQKSYSQTGVRIFFFFLNSRIDHFPLTIRPHLHERGGNSTRCISCKRAALYINLIQAPHCLLIRFFYWRFDTCHDKNHVTNHMFEESLIEIH